MSDDDESLAAPWPGLKDAEGQYARFRRVPMGVVLVRQIDRVNQYLSSGNRNVIDAVQSLYAMASPYLKRRVHGWEKRWRDRPCLEEVDVNGRAWPSPQPSDAAAWLELIVDGLTEAGVVHETVTVSVATLDGGAATGRKRVVARPRMETSRKKRQPPTRRATPGKLGRRALVGARPNAGPTLDHGQRGRDGGPSNSAVKPRTEPLSVKLWNQRKPDTEESL